MPRNSNDPPWRRLLPELIVLAVGLVLVVGLWIHNSDGGGANGGLSSTPPERTSTTLSPSASTPLIEDEAVTIEGDAKAAKGLRDAVLRAEDLPKGWIASGVTSGPNPLCDEDPVSRAQPIATVRSGFHRAPATDLITGTVAAYSDAAAAHQILEALAAGSPGCRVPELRYHVESLDDVGDEAVRISVDVPVGTDTIRNVAVVARRGGRIATVSATGNPIDESLVLRALRAEIGRL